MEEMMINSKTESKEEKSLYNINTKSEGCTEKNG